MATTLEYTTALLEIAEDKKAFQRIFVDLEKVFHLFVEHPKVFESLETIVSELKGSDVGKEVQKLVGVLAQNNHLKLLPYICANFWKMTCKREHDALVTAEVRSAIPLDDSQREKIREKLTKRVDGEVVVKYIVDESIIGGLVVRVGDWFLNASIKRKLELLGREIETKEHYL